MIICQPRRPRSANYTMPTEINEEALDQIVLHGTKDELSSFEILIPKYITENGNIFGEYDVAGDSKDVNNKIIIVQKLNMVDWIDSFHPDFFNTDKTDSIEYNYNQLLIIINVFIILCCIAMFGFVIYTITIYNNRQDVI